MRKWLDYALVNYIKNICLWLYICRGIISIIIILLLGMTSARLVTSYSGMDLHLDANTCVHIGYYI